ncbi:MAG: NADH-quinone oxidoreductase subunit NuoF [Anaerolineales bacterium]|jgi:NADH-quinone oxidoreductase subunit F|nr:NADH-quinone oxidoreductase subunit NuoF [Anaerolineales bacterium]MCC6986181.1 NADH-quinone oxidoreductase subunit NuoF [Anaerolineales bacterium]
MTHILLRHRDIPDINKFNVYKKNGGFAAFKNAVTKMKPNEVTDVVKNSGLRGRGGAGFPTGMKWSFIDRNNWPHYVVANADESEPGTFKDREIMENNPFQFLEGLAIGSYAVGANVAYIYLRGEFWQVAAFLDEKIAEMEEAGYLGGNLFGKDYSLKIYTHLGAGAYICGEETALLESLEGKRGQPRVRPPFPPAVGLYGKPTIINNVETFTNVPMILANGADWYKAIGTADSAGVKIFSLSGRVRKPGNYELPFGTTFRQLIYEHGMGIQEGRPIKAIMPAGASSSLIVVDEKVLDTPMDYASVRTVGADLGSASVIVLDDTVNMDWVVNKTIHFFKHESCGKCTTCREGNHWMRNLTDRIHHGQGSGDDVKLLLNVARQMQGKCLCALGEFSTMAVVTGIERFPDDFKKAVKA